MPSALQRELLAAAAQCVKPGGCLVYSTCSIEDEENGGQVDWFLDEMRDFELVSADGILPKRVLDARGCMFCFPVAHQTDGAFGVCFRRLR